jgi:ADP-ribose pyrophosphatase YjhB (NUDIX family)
MLWHDDRVLLVRQGRAASPRWMLPGGGVRPGESLQGSLERELREEIGCPSSYVGDPVAMVESIAPEGHPSGRHVVHVIFTVSFDDTTIDQFAPTDPDIHELRWFARDELMTVPIHPPIAGWIGAWRPGERFAYFGRLWAP